MSGSRSTRSTGGGGPIQGASAWPSSFTGPARYSPPFNTDAAEDDPPRYEEPYAPYAEAGSDHVDPYAADAYANGFYGAQSYETETYENESYAAGSYEGSYAYAESEFTQTDFEQAQYAQADYAAPEFASSTYLDGGYPAHEFPPEFEDFGAQGYGHTDIATAVGVAEVPPTELDIPGPRKPAGEDGPSPRVRGTQRRPAPRKVGWAGRAVQGLVLAALLGGVTAYVAFEKTVNISVDGTVQQVHSFASTVGAALASANISTGSHDLVSPAASTSLADNSTIIVKYGRPVSVTVNGTAEHAWVHSPTVGAALQELGIRALGARLVSVTANTPISRSGAEFSVFTMRRVTFLVDGKTDPLDTTDATIQAAMGDAGIALHNQDTASVPLNSVPTDGETISIMRITGTTEVKQVAIPYTTTKESDPTTYLGTTTVVTPGQDGEAQVTYALQIINGVKQAPKQISQTVVKQPVAEVDKIGTKALPTSASSLNWPALANCESGGDPHSVDSSGLYYGLYQFSISTWDSLGGTGLPSDASPAQQTSLAELLYTRDGAGQWPVCGHFLFS